MPELLDRVSSKYEILSNPLRLLILVTIQAKQTASWTDIVTGLKSTLDRDVNPNSVSFHLKKLQETGFVKLSGSEYEPDKLAGEFQKELGQLISQLRSEKD